jgi:hypothetical protein
MKYAIYQGKIGLYAAEYADTVKAIRDFPYINKDRLPVIINNVGGYTHFDKEYEKTKGFIKIVKVSDGEEPLTREQRYPKNSPNFEYGWIDLEGNTYNTGYEGHSSGARAICDEQNISGYNSESALEKLGWIKITMLMDREVGPEKQIFASYEKDYFITKKQADKLFDLGYWDHPKVQWYVSISEDRW